MKGIFTRESDDWLRSLVYYYKGMVSRIDIHNYFKNNYEESRETFRGLLSKVQEVWPEAKLHQHSIGENEDNTIDVIYAEATSSNDKVAMLTSGEHGIEGYAGAAVLHLFVDQYLSSIDPSTTGVCFVHAINPWGMRHFRRVTENNVDLNRNYFLEETDIPYDLNENYEKESHIFLPKKPLDLISKEKTELYEALSKGMMNEGYKGIKQAKGMGQFQFERGVYFGGYEEEPSGSYIKSWQKHLLERFNHVIHMDWHTALGPPNEVTMVITENHGKKEDELKSTYGMENIQVYSPDDVKGDSTNYFYELRDSEYPSTSLFSALFEFGTFGTSREAELREFTTIILENQLYWEGTEHPESREWVREELMNMFYPQEEEWKEAVLKEACTAIEAVLRQENILTSSPSTSRNLF